MSDARVLLGRRLGQLFADARKKPLPVRRIATVEIQSGVLEALQQRGGNLLPRPFHPQRNHGLGAVGFTPHSLGIFPPRRQDGQNNCAVLAALLDLLLLFVARRQRRLINPHRKPCFEPLTMKLFGICEIGCGITDEAIVEHSGRTSLLGDTSDDSVLFGAKVGRLIVPDLRVDWSPISKLTDEGITGRRVGNHRLIL